MKILDYFRRKTISKKEVPKKEPSIQELLKKVLLCDPYFKGFGSRKHTYKLKPCADLKEIVDFEEKYHITLPHDYKTFITQIGNGGAGPYYGIYPLKDEKNCDEYLYASQPCRLFPNMDLKDWENILKEYDALDDDVDDETYDRVYNSIFQGMITIGTQGCTYDMMLVLTGKYKGHVVYIDRNLEDSVPFFVYEKNFITWYKRWLIEMIEGYDTTWFGFRMGGNQDELIDKLKNCMDAKEKNIILNSMFKFKSLSEPHKTCLYHLYEMEKDHDIKYSLLELLAHYGYPPIKDIVKKLLNQEDKSDALKIICSFDLNGVDNYYDELLKELEHLDYDKGHIVLDLLMKSTHFNAKDVARYTNHQDAEMRKTILYTLGRQKNKILFLEKFIKALKDEDPFIVHTALQAVYDMRIPRLLPIYEKLLKKYYDYDPCSICENLEKAFKTLGKNYDEVLQKIKKAPKS